MSNRLIPWLSISIGGFLIWGAIKNRNPLDVAKGMLSGEIKSPSDLGPWAEDVIKDTKTLERGDPIPPVRAPQSNPVVGGSDPLPGAVWN